MKVPSPVSIVFVLCLFISLLCTQVSAISSKGGALRLPHLYGSQQQDSSNGISFIAASSADGEEVDRKGSSASVQFMITNKMKKVLINDLGYSLGEVDDMEPQIAAVVIEKALNRPKAGMPASWRKSNREVSQSDKRIKALIKKWKKVKSFVSKAAATVQMQVAEQSQRPVVRGLASVALLWLVRQPLQNFAVASLDATRNAVQNIVLSAPTPPEPPKQPVFSKRSLLSVLQNRPSLAAPAKPHQEQSSRPWWNVLGLFGVRGSSSGKVDLKALSKVRKLGFIDSMRVKFDIFKMRL